MDWLVASRDLWRLLRGQWGHPERLRRLQLQRLEAHLAHVYETVPFYRRRWPCPPEGESLRTRGLAGLPRVRRESLAADPLAFQSDGRSVAELEVLERTPLVVGAGSPPCEGALELRRRRACGVRIRDRVVTLEPCSSADLERGKDSGAALPGEGWLQCRERLSLDEAPELHLAFLRRYRPHHIEAPATYLEDLARIWGDRERAGVPLRSLTTRGEWIPERARRRLRELFGVPVLDVYGSPELGEVAWQCREGGGYHVNGESVWVEIADEDGQPVDPGTAGEIVITQLASRGLPLVRYATGDRARLQPGACGCGRKLLQLEELQGRTQGALVLAGGRRVSPFALTMAIEQCPGVQRYRVVQHTDDWLDVPVVVRGPADPVASAVRRSLTAEVGTGVHVGVRIVPELPPDPWGVHRTVCVARSARSGSRGS